MLRVIQASILSAIFTLQAGSVWASDSSATRAACFDNAAEAEQRYGLPEGLLQSIVFVESGGNPFAVNYKGKGYMYGELETAQGFVAGLLEDGRTVIDVGCGQVNLKWHPDAFANLDEAFDPASNLDYAARHLRDLAGPEKNWKRAVGHYHSPSSPDRAERYRNAVYAAFRKRGGSFEDMKSKPIPASSDVDVAVARDYEDFVIYEVVSTKPSLTAATKGLRPEPSADVKKDGTTAAVSSLPGAIAIKKW